MNWNLVAGRTNTQLSQEDRNLSEIILQAIERVRPWAAKYVQSKLDWGFSEQDFAEQIYCRVAAAHRRNHFLVATDPGSADEAVKEALKHLVQETRRLAFARSKREVPIEDNKEDPRGLAFTTALEAESRAQKLLSRVPPALLPMIESLYGLHGEEEMTTAAVAERLGVSEDVLRQRLSRLRAALRRSLGKII